MRCNKLSKDRAKKIAKRLVRLIEIRFDEVVMPALVFLLCCISLSAVTPALAAPTPYVPPVTFNDVMLIFNQGINILHETVVSFAMRTLYFCAVCAFILAGFTAIFRRTMVHDNVSIVLGTFVKLLIILGLLNVMIQYGSNISRDFLNSFMTLPALQFGDVSASTLINEYFKLIEAFTNILITQNSVIFVVFLFINFTLVSAFMIYLMLTYIMAIFSCSLCTLLLGFAILKYFRSFIIVFVRTLFLYCLKLFAMFFVFNIGHSIMLMMIISLQSQLASGFIVKVQDIAMMTFIMAFILALAFACSHLAGRIIHMFDRGWHRS